MIFPPEKHMQGLRNLIAYYRAYWVWQTDNKEIRKWNLHQSRASIMCAAICYRMARKRERNVR